MLARRSRQEGEGSTLNLRRQKRSGCCIESRHGRLRLRFRWGGRQVSRALDLADTPANRAELGRLAKAVGALIKAGKDPIALLDSVQTRPARFSRTSTGPTVASYYETWIVERTPLVRKALARDYRRHMTGYVIPRLGAVSLADLRPADIRGLQSELLARGLSVKTVKNAISGSLRAMVGQAVADELVMRDVFAGLTWPEWTPPEPDPLTPDERSSVLKWFEGEWFASGRRDPLPHPSFYAYVHTLFWTGMRPSEASGLQWRDVDLEGGRLYVRRSRHLYGYNAPKTRSARRTIALFPESVRLLRALRPPDVQPDAPVFVSLAGTPIEPKNFSQHWYRALGELEIRKRGLYCTKDTFVTTALHLGVKIAWLEQQTGVRYETLRRHYGRWMPGEDESELHRFQALDERLFRSPEPTLFPTEGTNEKKAPSLQVRGGGLEPPRVFSPLAPQTSASANSAILADGESRVS